MKTFQTKIQYHIASIIKIKMKIKSNKTGTLLKLKKILLFLKIKIIQSILTCIIRKSLLEINNIRKHN
jgi:flagellar biosynthesis protein FliR